MKIMAAVSVLTAISVGYLLFSGPVKGQTGDLTSSHEVASPGSGMAAPDRGGVGLAVDLGLRMARRMQAAIDRMRKLEIRMRSRTDKLEAQGRDVSRLVLWMATINTNLDSAQTALSKFRSDLGSLPSATDRGGVMQTLVNDGKMVEDSSVAAYTVMRQVAQQLLVLSGMSPSSY